MKAPSNGAVAPTMDLVKAELVAFGQAHPEIAQLTVFGSVARADTSPDSDLDLLVKFVPGGLPPGIAAFAYLQNLECKLAATVGHGVHLIEQEAADDARRIGNASLFEAVARDGKVVYELESAAT